MDVVPSSEPPSPVRWTGLLIWTGATAAVQTIFVRGMLAPDNSISAGAGITVGFFGSWAVAAMVSQRTWLAAWCGGTLMAGIWPMWRWGVDGVDDAAGAFVGAAVVFTVIGLTYAAARWASARGWIADQTPARRRTLVAVTLISGITRLTGIFNAVWNRRLGMVALVVIPALLFWPSRKPRPAPDQTATV